MQRPLPHSLCRPAACRLTSAKVVQGGRLPQAGHVRVAPRIRVVAVHNAGGRILGSQRPAAGAPAAHRVQTSWPRATGALAWRGSACLIGNCGIGRRCAGTVDGSDGSPCQVTRQPLPSDWWRAAAGGGRSGCKGWRRAHLRCVVLAPREALTAARSSTRRRAFMPGLVRWGRGPVGLVQLTLN